jgi:hypothetical protein
MVVLEGQGINLYAAKVQIHRTIMDKTMKDNVKNVAVGYGDGMVVVFNKRTSKIYGAWNFVDDNEEPADEEIIYSFFRLGRLGQVHDVPVVALDLVDDDEEDYTD